MQNGCGYLQTVQKEAASTDTAIVQVRKIIEE